MKSNLSSEAVLKKKMKTFWKGETGHHEGERGSTKPNVKDFTEKNRKKPALWEGRLGGGKTWPRKKTSAVTENQKYQKSPGTERRGPQKRKKEAFSRRNGVHQRERGENLLLAKELGFTDEMPFRKRRPVKQEKVGEKLS